MHNGVTVTQFIIEEQRRLPGATGDFTSLLNDIVTACKVISNGVNKGALIGVLGTAESENVQGETQKKMDIISNEVVIKSNEWAGHLAAMASEEEDDIYPITARYPKANTCCCSIRWMAPPTSTSTSRWVPFSPSCAAPKA